MGNSRAVLDERDHELLDAVAQARTGLAEGGIPIGAALAADGVLLGAGRNWRRTQLPATGTDGFRRCDR